MRRKNFLVVGLAAGALLSASLGCTRQEAPQPATPASPLAKQQAEPAPTAAPSAKPAASVTAAAKDEANQIFATRCTTCHGARGAGNGPASEGLTPPPRNFQDPAWQESVTDTHIEQIVQYGGAAVGKSPAMPANPDLMSKPEVVIALRALVRSLAR